MLLQTKIKNNSYRCLSTTSLTVSNLKNLGRICPSSIYYSVQDEWFLKINSKYILETLLILKNHNFFLFRQLRDITAIDYPERKLRFDILYQLLSIAYNCRITLVVAIPEGLIVHSVSTIYLSANWYEREIWDRYGVFFSNHLDLRRILTDYGFKGHPLRKDFPMGGFFEIMYNNIHKRIVYVKVTFVQAYRQFELSVNFIGGYTFVN